MKDKDRETEDVFHRGRFCLVQPAQKGHRAGIDSMILASCVPEGFSGNLVDLGSGAGAVGFAVLSRCPKARVTLVENSLFMLSFARKTICHPCNVSFQERIKLLAADISLKGEERCKAGLINNSFDFALMNPPFNNPMDRASPDQEKANAHIMHIGLLDLWIRSAAAIVRPGGTLALIVRPFSLAEILSALSGRFGAIRIVPIYPRHNREAIRVVVVAIRASRTILRIMPPLVLHKKEGHGFSAFIEAVNNGRASLWNYHLEREWTF